MSSPFFTPPKPIRGQMEIPCGTHHVCGFCNNSHVCDVPRCVLAFKMPCSSPECIAAWNERWPDGVPAGTPHSQYEANERRQWVDIPVADDQGELF